MLYHYTIFPLEKILSFLLFTLYGVTDSYLFAIILFSIIVRIITTPIEKLANKSVVKEHVIKAILAPQIAKIKGIYKGGERHEAIKRLYARYTYYPFYAIRSMFGLLVQLPFFIAAYYMISEATILQGVVVPLIGDLSQQDKLLFGSVNLLPFVMTAVNLIALYTTPNFNKKDSIQGICIALLFFILLYESPAALLIYWTVNQAGSLVKNIFGKFVPKQIFRKYLNISSGSSGALTLNSTLSVRMLHIFTIVNIAVAQPLFDQLGNNPTFFTVHQSSLPTLIWFTISLSLLLPSLLVFIGIVVKFISDQVLNIYQITLIGVCAALFILPVLNRLFEERTYIIFILTLLVGVGVAFCYKYFKAPKAILTLASPVVLLFPLLFLVFSPVAKFDFASPVVAMPDAKVGNITPIFFILFDEIGLSALLKEDGEIDTMRFPGFGRLQKVSTWYPNATAVATSTEVAIPAFLSGSLKNEQPHLAPIATQFPNNLFTWLGDRYKLNVVEILTKLCPDTLLKSSVLIEPQKKKLSLLNDTFVVYFHLILPQSIAEEYLPPITASWADFRLTGEESSSYKKSLEETEDFSKNGLNLNFPTFNNFLKNIDPSADNSLNFYHFKLPHLPYKFLPSGRRYTRGRSIFPDGLKSDSNPWTNSEQLLKVVNHRYLSQIGYCDRLLGDFLDELSKKNLFDNSLIIVTSDHGVSNRPGEFRRRATASNLGDVLSIPLFIKYPKQTSGELDQRHASSIDILATIGDVIQADIPWKTDGISLRRDSFPIQNEIPVVSSFRLWQPKQETWSRYNLKIKRDELNISINKTRKKQERIFGNSTNFTRLVPKSAFDNLVGRNLQEINIGTSSRFQLSELEGHNLFDHVSLNSGFLPALVKAHVNSSDVLDIAISLNGIITNITKTVFYKNTNGFVTSLIPEYYFREGHNKISVFVIENKIEKITLRPLLLSQEQSEDIDPQTGTAHYFDGKTSISKNLIIPDSSQYELKIVIKSDVLFDTFFDISDSTPPMPLVGGGIAIYEDKNGYTISFKNIKDIPIYVNVECSTNKWQTLKFVKQKKGISIFLNNQLVKKISGKFGFSPRIKLGKGHENRYWSGWIKKMTITIPEKTGSRTFFSYP